MCDTDLEGLDMNKDTDKHLDMGTHMIIDTATQGQGLEKIQGTELIINVKKRDQGQVSARSPRILILRHKTEWEILTHVCTQRKKAHLPRWAHEQ
jgi:hypothetical protein